MSLSLEVTCPRFIPVNTGLTESCTVISTWALDKRCDLSGGAGQLLPGIVGRVEKPDGTLADFDEPGELVVKTQALALGYANNLEAYEIIFLVSFTYLPRCDQNEGNVCRWVSN